MKKDDKSTIKAEEIESLNVDDLDIEELERRVELASTVPLADLYDCGTNCGANCGSNKIVIEAA